MKKYMNTNVNPCDDFYQFACGKWIENNPLPPGYGKSDMNMKMEREVLHYLKRFLALPKSNDEHVAHTKAKNHYKACIDKETRKSRGATPLVELLETLGGWPIINDTWDGSNFDWILVAEQLSKYSTIFGFIGFNVLHDKNSRERKIYMTTPNLVLDPHLYLEPSKNTDKLKNYRNFIVKIATLMGGSEDNVRKSAEEIVNFETKMANKLLVLNILK
ncbi:neprilysin-4-like [Cimex lectularius]|uniref:Peptidase M13 N-terminal domain-containing protein n=1 Tax=Cimex lectularius TaxID=79782 RepID=A0A8I6SVG4_CIMLE|nr:neprilysin-4-like [Cimex lectularius]